MQSMLHPVKTPLANVVEIKNVRSGIRTHAYKCRLRPERSALDRSAILTNHKTKTFHSLIYNDWTDKRTRLKAVSLNDGYWNETIR